MEIRIIQSQVGSFNWCNPSQKSFSFSMGLFENNQLIEQDGIKAKIYYSGEPDDEHDFRDAKEQLDYVFEKCYNYSHRVISSTNYGAQCLLFAKLYCENYEAINEEMLRLHKISVQAKIDKLQKELQWSEIVPDISYSVNGLIDAEINKYKKWRSSTEKELSELKEDSETYQKKKKTLDDYASRIEKLESQKIKATA